MRDEGPLPGLSDIIPAGREFTTSEIEELAQAASDADLPFQETMGLPEAWASLVRSLSARHLVRELPYEERALSWFESHVPPGGTSAVRFSRTTSADNTASLSVFGSGLGKGRAVTITVASESEPRSVCASYSIDLRVRPRVYSRAGAESVEVAVVDFLGHSVELMTPCPRCRSDGGTIDPFDYVVEPYIDLRRDSVPSRIRELVELQEETTIDAGFSVAALPVALKLTAVVKRGATFEIESLLPPGHRYRKFRRLVMGSPIHSPMWSIDE